MQPLSRRQMAWRAAQDIQSGTVVNLGIGLPTLCSDFIPAGREITSPGLNGCSSAVPAPRGHSSSAPRPASTTNSSSSWEWQCAGAPRSPGERAT